MKSCLVVFEKEFTTNAKQDNTTLPAGAKYSTFIIALSLTVTRIGQAQEQGPMVTKLGSWEVTIQEFLKVKLVTALGRN